VETIIFELPPTMNEIIKEARNGIYSSSKLKKQWTDISAIACLGKKKFPSRVWTEWEWHIVNLSRDEDNLVASRKFICDGIVDAGIILSDSCRIIMTPVLHWHYKDDSDWVKLTISDRPDFLFNSMIERRDEVMSQI
jgi:hypothetical protein